jgi:hypothetical protein
MVEFFSRRTYALHQRNDDGRRIELHGVAHLFGNGTRCASHEGRSNLLTRRDVSVFAIDAECGGLRRQKRRSVGKTKI